MPCLKAAPWGEGGPSANAGSLGFEGNLEKKEELGQGWPGARGGRLGLASGLGSRI